MAWSTNHMRQHLHECSAKPTDTTSDVTTATLQVPPRLHISALLPTPTKSAQLPQPLPITPTTPATPKPQTPSVPDITPVPPPTSVTPSIAPVQPHQLACPHHTPAPNPGTMGGSYSP